MAWRADLALGAIGVVGAVASGGKYYIDNTVEDAAQAEVRKGLGPVYEYIDDSKDFREKQIESQIEFRERLSKIEGALGVRH